MMIPDKVNRNEDLRVFGRDTEKIFKEIDVIRRKQVELAAEHINLESTEEIKPFSAHEETVESNAKRNPIHFENQEKALKSLMGKLDTLGQIMNDFREASDLNPHTVERRLSDFQATTTAPTTPDSSTVNDKASTSTLAVPTSDHSTSI